MPHTHPCPNLNPGPYLIEDLELGLRQGTLGNISNDSLVIKAGLDKVPVVRNNIEGSLYHAFNGRERRAYEVRNSFLVALCKYVRCWIKSGDDGKAGGLCRYSKGIQIGPVVFETEHRLPDIARIK